MKFTLANILTLVRLFLAPLFLVFLLTGSPWSITTAVILFIIGAFTDYLDGYIARRMGESSEQGAFLDPLADKILTTSAFIGFYFLDLMPLWMLIVIVVRDFGTTLLRTISSSAFPLRTSVSAKWKTFVQMGFIVYTLALLWAAEASPSEAIRTFGRSWLYSDVTYYCILAITLFTLWTFIQYIIVNPGLLKRGSQN
ncbi:MAG: CDP-diacylglycerol--glycerol-3-phosphate 3-phosphatidyltransferase [bacterium]|nr:CDP-diacylglycerol--glycerol-3-phosphate 3-phosphatidyltransferase [bacterium]